MPHGIADDKGWKFAASYGAHNLTLNLDKLGAEWFDLDHGDERVTSLLIHEFAHHYERNHLSASYHEACTLLGGRSTAVALRRPDVFR
jgi:hypothetical protein